LTAPGHLEVTGLEEDEHMVDSRTCVRDTVDGEACSAIADMLARVGDKWSLLIVRTLGGAGPLRFNELRRQIDGISQKMLSSTLKVLERDGLVSRSVIATVPPQVEYALTDLGSELLGPVRELAEWTAANTPRIVAARADYDARAGAAATA
jgi:DNA-binding HxlR family transcriptional regulator